MPYARIPDELCNADVYLDAVERHPAAGTLVLFGRSYAARESSDGFVPDRQLRRFVEDPDARQGALDALVAVGLFERIEDRAGYQMTDYLNDNMSAEEYAAKRAEDRERQRRSRARRAGDEPPGRDTDRESHRDADVTADDRHDGVTRSSSRGRPQTQTRTQTQVTADAATAPRADAPEASGGGDVKKLGPHPDLPNARAAMVTAGFSGDAIDAKRETAKINKSLHEHPRRIQDWPALGTWVADERAAGRCRSLNPAAALRYALNSHTQAGMRRAARAQAVPARTTAPGGARVNGTTALPSPDEGAADAWTRLREAYEEAAGDRVQPTVVAAVHPLRLDGSVLEITAQPHAAGYVETQLVPSLRAVAAQSNGSVRWIDPTTATTREAVAA